VPVCSGEQCIKKPDSSINCNYLDILELVAIVCGALNAIIPTSWQFSNAARSQKVRWGGARQRQRYAVEYRNGGFMWGAQRCGHAGGFLGVVGTVRRGAMITITTITTITHNVRVLVECLMSPLFQKHEEHAAQETAECSQGFQKK